MKRASPRTAAGGSGLGIVSSFSQATTPEGPAAPGPWVGMDQGLALRMSFPTDLVLQC